MKIIPILTAIAVLGVLYAVVFERDRLMEFAQSDAPIAEVVEEVESSPDPVEDAVRVVATRSVARTIDDAIVLRGRTEAARQVTVAAETTGLVISEPLRAGATVAAGDLMCRLDPGTREASLAEARARLTEAEGRVPEAEASVVEAVARVREAEINLNAARQLSQDGFASETRLVSAEAAMEAAGAGVERANSSVASAKAGIEAAAAEVASAEREIERLTITAPFSGLLETDAAELGTLMQPGTPCATIINIDQIKLVGFVPELNVDKVVVGALAGARLTGGREVQGRVTFLSRSADELTRTFRVEVTVENPDLAISDGQTAEILIAADGRLAHLVPQSSLTLDDDGLIGVRTVNPDNVVSFYPITVLRDTADGVWVDGLPETVDIITVGQEFVVDGVTVIPTLTEAKG